MVPLPVDLDHLASAVEEQAAVPVPPEGEDMGQEAPVAVYWDRICSVQHLAVPGPEADHFAYHSSEVVKELRKRSRLE